MADSAVRQRTLYRICCEPRRAAWLTLAISAILSAQNAWAGLWHVTPRLSLGQIYTDNVTLAPAGQKQWGLFSEITPGLSVHGRGGRVSANLDYEMQGFVSVRHRSQDSVYHRLRATSTTELARQWLYLDASAGITQQIISAQGPIALSNIYRSGNRTNVYTYTLSPYLRHNFGGYMNALLRYSYGQALYGKHVAKQVASNARFEKIDAQLGSGFRFGPLQWGLSFHKADQRRQPAENFRTENALANVSYQLFSTVRLMGQAGYANNHYQTYNRLLVNGTYWGVGLGWTPDRYFSVSALKGNRFETATVTVAPSPRTSLSVTYRDRPVGLNPGKVWSGVFGLHTRHTSWAASYTEDTTTVQELALQQAAFFTTVDPLTGKQVPNPATGLPTVYYYLIPYYSLTNDVLVRKTASASFGYQDAFTGLRLTGFDQRINYQISGEHQRINGVDGSWSWRFGTRTSSVLTTGWRNNDYSSIQGTSTLWYVQESIIRRIAPRLTSTLSYRHISEGRGLGLGYDANELNFVLTMYF